MELFGEVLALAMVALVVWGIREPIGRLFAGRWDVFVSYRSVDKAVVEWIASELSRSGIRVWIDHQEIAAADRVRGSFRTPISLGLQRARCAILCTSASYWKSDYCRKEASLIMRRFRHAPGRLIVVKLDNSHDLLAEMEAPSGLNVIEASREHGDTFDDAVPAVVDSILSILQETGVGVTRALPNSGFSGLQQTPRSRPLGRRR